MRKNVIEKIIIDFQVPAEKAHKVEELVTKLNSHVRGKHCTNKVTSVLRNDTLSTEQIQTVKFDRYHAESRTGIRAGMTALKRFWSTYHYVPTVCRVAVSKDFVDNFIKEA